MERMNWIFSSSFIRLIPTIRGSDDLFPDAPKALVTSSP